MIKLETLRKLALSFPQTAEGPHSDKIAFRVKKKVFATYDPKNNQACIKLSEIDQTLFTSPHRAIIYPVENKWGKKGWTIIEMDHVPMMILADAVATAYFEVASPLPSAR